MKTITMVLTRAMTAAIRWRPYTETEVEDFAYETDMEYLLDREKMIKQLKFEEVFWFWMGWSLMGLALFIVLSY